MPWPQSLQQMCFVCRKHPAYSGGICGACYYRLHHHRRSPQDDTDLWPMRKWVVTVLGAGTLVGWLQLGSVPWLVITAATVWACWKLRQS
jgi:hypothetical protein